MKKIKNVNSIKSLYSENVSDLYICKDNHVAIVDVHGTIFFFDEKGIGLNYERITGLSVVELEIEFMFSMINKYGLFEISKHTLSSDKKVRLPGSIYDYWMTPGFTDEDFDRIRRILHRDWSNNTIVKSVFVKGKIAEVRDMKDNLTYMDASLAPTESVYGTKVVDKELPEYLESYILNNKVRLSSIRFNQSKLQQLPLLKAADVVYGWHDEAIHKIDGWLDINVVDRTMALVTTNEGVKVLKARRIQEYNADHVYFHAEHYSLLSCAHQLKEELKKAVFIDEILVVI